MSLKPNKIEASDLDSQAQVESLLQQLALVEPPESLDHKIVEMCVTQESSVNPVLPVTQARFDWNSLIGVALAASLFGLLLGLSFSDLQASPDQTITNGPAKVTKAIEMKQVAKFEELHGHSAQKEYSQCSTCHTFETPKEQVVKKWNHADHSKYKQNCSLCHVGNVNPPKPTPPRIPG